MIARILSVPILLYLLGYALFAVLLPRPGDARRTDAIVVLTGGPNRLQRGFDLLEQQRAKRMLISGVERTVRPQELAHRYEVRPALFTCCIDLGRESVDTRSNAEETAHWLERRKPRSIRLITTDWHMPRARFELSRQIGDGVVIYPDAVASNPSFRQLFTEYNKYLLRRAAVILGL